MKKKILYGFLSAIVLASLVTFPGLAREARPGPANFSASADISPWHIGWADKNTSAHVGGYPSVAYSPIDGLAYISYYDSVGHNLMLTSPAANGGCGTGNAWWCRPVDGDTNTTPPDVGTRTNGDVGQYSSIDFWKGTTAKNWKLGIAYYDATDNALKYAEWSPAYFLPGINTGWKFFIVETAVFPSDTVGTYTSLKFTSDGKPWIAYYTHWYITLIPPTTAWFGQLNLAWQVTGNSGNCGPGGKSWKCDVVDSGSDAGVGQYASLGLGYDDKPYMSYYDAVNGDLRYAHYDGPASGNCSSGSDYDCTIINQAGDVGMGSSLTAPKSSSDKVRIAYYDRTNGQLKFAQNSSGSGCFVATWDCSNIVAIGTNLPHIGISMALDQNDSPVIAYEDASSGTVAFQGVAKPGIFGNCGPTITIGIAHLHTWECDDIDGGYGYTYVDVGLSNAIAINSSGVSTIAYLESDSYSDTDYLKVAYNQINIFAPLMLNHH